MKKKKIILPIALSLVGIASFVAISNLSHSSTSRAEYVASSLFDLHGLKAKTSTSAGFNEMYSDARKGLELFSYNSGVSADYKETLTSAITLDLKSSTLNQTSPNLYHYSITFQNLDNNESFKLHVEDNGTSNIYYVEADGKKAGFYGGTANGWKEAGFTKLFNNSSKYTTFEYSLASESTKLTFDPTSLSIYAKYDRYNIRVWDFKSDYVDGKQQIARLEEMKKYKISFNFEESKANAKAELVIYSIGDKEFSSPFFSDATGSIDADFSIKALTNQAYVLPDPINAERNDVKVKIFDGSNVLYDENLKDMPTFTPTKGKAYYVVYYTDTNSGWFKLEAVPTVDNNFIMSPEFNMDSVGYMAKFNIPNCSISSNLLSQQMDAVVTIAKKDGAALKDYTNVKPGFDFIFDELPEGKNIVYTFTYSLKSDNDNFAYTKVFEKKVIKINETIEMDSYDEKYALNDMFTIHDATVYRDGNIYHPSYKTVSPKGNVITDKEFLLTEPGFYTVTYSYSKGSFTRSFAAVNDVKSLFSNSNSSGVYAYSSTNDSYSGYRATVKANGKIVYNKTVDLSSSTKNDVLIGLVAEPTESGTADFTTMVVTMSDANDPTNYVNIRLRQGNVDASNGTGICAAAYNQDYQGWYYNPWFDKAEQLEGNKSHEFGGFLHSHDYKMGFGTYKTFEKNVLKLYYDYSTKGIYSDWDNHANGIYGTEHPIGQVSRTLVADLDDLNCYKKLWNGFSSGKVNISVAAYGINGSSANFLVTDIYGSDLSKNMIDDVDGPTIDIDKEGNNFYPQGVVGREYNLLNAKIEDEASGVKETLYSVIDPSNKEVAVLTRTNGQKYFVPKTKGTYKITYIARDNFDNVSSQTLSISVINDEEVQSLKVSVTPDKTNYYLGETVNFVTPITSGGVGYEKVIKTVQYGSQKENVEIQNTYFTPTKSGKYYITYTAIDYVGHSATAEYAVNVERSVSPIFDESSVSMPMSFINGMTYEFKRYTATYYTSDELSSKVELVGKVVVEDANGKTTIGDNGLYTPSYSESYKEAKVSIVFEYGNGQEDIHGPYSVNIVPASSGSKFLANYFLKNNADFSVYPTFGQMVVNDTTKDASISFVRPINENILSVEIAPAYDGEEEQPRNNFKSVTLSFQDSMNNGEVVDVTIEARDKGEEVWARVNNDEATKIEGSLYSNVASAFDLSVKYDATSKTFVSSLGTLIGKAETTRDGNAFDGFSSEEAYVSISINEVSGPSALKVLAIGEQNINNAKKDNKSPTLIVSGNYYGTFALGEEIVLPKAKAFDVLSYCYGATVTVMYQDGTYCRDKNGNLLNDASASEERIFIPDQYGIFEVTYSAKDEAGNTCSIVKNIIVSDTTAPTFKLNYDIPASISKGTTLDLTDYTVSDNLDSSDKLNVNIYLVGPDNITRTLRYTENDGTVKTDASLKNGKFTFQNTGSYRLIYMVSDTNGNTSVFGYSFMVK